MSEISADQWREARLAKGWTQTELSAIAGISSPSRVSDVERGLPPGRQVERRLREALGMIGPDGPGPMDQKATVTVND